MPYNGLSVRQAESEQVKSVSLRRKNQSVPFSDPKRPDKVYAHDSFQKKCSLRYDQTQLYIDIIYIYNIDSVFGTDTVVSEHVSYTRLETYQNY